MSIERYDNEKLLAKQVLRDKLNDTLEIEFSPYSEELLQMFNFFKDEFERASKYDVQNGILIFNTLFGVNARAAIIDGHSIIEFNGGLLIQSINRFFKNTKIDDFLKDRFILIYPYFDNKINVLLHQIIVNFTFYHELAHIIQKTLTLNQYLNEQDNDEGEFNMLNHKLEMDADEFSALYLGSQIHQYAFKIFKQEIDTDKVENLLELFCTGVMLNFLLFKSVEEEIYFEKSTHPHAVIRILNVLIVIIDYLGSSPRMIKKNIKIQRMSIIDKIVFNVYDIEFNLFEEKNAVKFRESLKHKEDIINYIKKIRKFEVQNLNLAFNVWNNKIFSS